uniref:C2H2-type domain-containing protein n=1 Tax=Cacopsylla melanoneura TaxID=428564 RepID=A0A8D8WE00_9HEMI
MASVATLIYFTCLLIFLTMLSGHRTSNHSDNSEEDITLDDDDEAYPQPGTSQMANSQGTFGNWQQMVGDQTGADVPSGQDTGAQNSQDKEKENKAGEKSSSEKTDATCTDNTAEPSDDTTNTDERLNRVEIELTEVKVEPVEQEELDEENKTDEYSTADDKHETDHNETVEDINEDEATVIENSGETYDPEDESNADEPEVDDVELEKEPVDIWDADGKRKCSIYCPETIHKDDFVEEIPHICPLCPTIVLPCDHLLKEHMRFVHGWFKSKRNYHNH